MKTLITLGLLTSAISAFAAESFGGIGLAIYASPQGAEVAQVVMNGAAFEAGIAEGDILLSADGVSLAGETLEYDMDVLRGAPGKDLELSVLRGEDTLTFLVRRSNIVVENTSEDGVFLKDSKDNSFEYLDEVNLPGISANVYAKIGNSEDEAIDLNDSKNFRSLNFMNRKNLSIKLESSGRTAFSIFSAKGQKVSSFDLECSAGENQVAWNGTKLPSGNYFVRVTQNGSATYYKGVLR